MGQLSRIVRALDAVLSHGFKAGEGQPAGDEGQVATFFTRNWKSAAPNKGGKDRHGRTVGRGGEGRLTTRDRVNTAESGSEVGLQGGHVSLDLTDLHVASGEWLGLVVRVSGEGWTGLHVARVRLQHKLNI